MMNLLTMLEMKILSIHYKKKCPILTDGAQLENKINILKQYGNFNLKYSLYINIWLF